MYVLSINVGFQRAGVVDSVSRLLAWHPWSTGIMPPKLGMMVHSCSPNIKKAKVGVSRSSLATEEVQGNPGLCESGKEGRKREERRGKKGRKEGTREKEGGWRDGGTEVGRERSSEARRWTRRYACIIELKQSTKSKQICNYFIRNQLTVYCCCHHWLHPDSSELAD